MSGVSSKRPGGSIGVGVLYRRGEPAITGDGLAPPRSTGPGSGVPELSEERRF